MGLFFILAHELLNWRVRRVSDYNSISISSNNDSNSKSNDSSSSSSSDIGTNIPDYQTLLLHMLSATSSYDHLMM